MREQLQTVFDKWNESCDFSGVLSITGGDDVIFERAYGYRNISELLPNKISTAFAIASGTKFFTALSVCRLIDCGNLSLSDRIGDVISHDLGTINRDVTVFQLLTHTSGIGDYIDEEESGDYFDILKLYDTRPVHKWDSLDFYLPMFKRLPAKFNPGERFGYSNAGFILLGLVIEAVSGQSYHSYVKTNIIDPLYLSHTGFYRMNSLPGNTALGYIFNEARGEMETNILYMPVMGGSDGGLFTCAADLATLWSAVINGNILSPSMREQMFTPQVERSKGAYYGLGVYMREVSNKKAYYIIGGDFGADFISGYFPKNGVTVSVLGNTEMDTYPLFINLLDAF